MEDLDVVGESREANPVTAPVDETLPGAPMHFAVKFEETRNPLHLNTGPARLRGPGRITFEGACVGFDGKFGMLRWLRKNKHFQVPESEVLNVQCLGRSVTFQVRTGTGALQTVGLTSPNTLSAVRLAARLPRQQTEAFAVSSAEHTDFHKRLEALSPTAIAVPVIVGINIVVFIAMCLSGVGLFTVDGNAVLPWGSNYGPLTTSGQWWRLATNIFVHFGLLHVALNMFALYSSGRTVERLFGTTRFVVLYLFAGIAASMASLLWNPAINSAGASGAIFGVFGGMLAFVMNKRNEVPQSVMVEHRNSTMIFAAYSLFYGMAHTGIDNAAHVGGLLAGLAMGFVLARPLTSEARAAPQPRNLLLSIALGTALLLSLSWPIAHPSTAVAQTRRFDLLLHQVSDEETAALKSITTLQQRMVTERMDDQQMASALASEVVPKWDAIYREITAVPLQPGDRNFKLRGLMLSYFDARRQQFSLLVRSQASHDAELQAQAIEEKDVADKILSDIKSEQIKLH